VVGSWDSLDVALLGIGALQPSPLLADSGNSLNPDDLAGLSEQGAVGDVCLHFFDTNGVHVPSSFEDRTIGISAGKLRAIPRKIGFAGGPRKLEAIRAAAIGGWVDVLVTDSATAAALLVD
jgi:DNA-binding transcriptional regulator LsrR (DeoR family)